MALTEEQAYLAMFRFLELQYAHGAEELGGLLGAMSLLPDGSPADSAHAAEWKAAVAAAVAGDVNAQMELKR